MIYTLSVINIIRTIYPHRLKKNLEVTKYETPEEVHVVQWPKCCKYNNQDEYIILNEEANKKMEYRS